MYKDCDVTWNDNAFDVWFISVSSLLLWKEIFCTKKETIMVMVERSDMFFSKQEKNVFEKENSTLSR